MSEDEAQVPASEVPPSQEASPPGPGDVSAEDETAPPPVEAGAQDMEPIVLALVFLVPPILLGGSAIALAFSKQLAWNPLAVGLVIGLVASVGFYFVVRRVFAAS